MDEIVDIFKLCAEEMNKEKVFNFMNINLKVTSLTW